MLIQEGIVTVIMLDSQEPLKLKIMLIVEVGKGLQLDYIVHVNQDLRSCCKNGQNTK